MAVGPKRPLGFNAAEELRAEEASYDAMEPSEYRCDIPGVEALERRGVREIGDWGNWQVSLHPWRCMLRLGCRRAKLFEGRQAPFSLLVLLDAILYARRGYHIFDENVSLTRGILSTMLL